MNPPPSFPGDESFRLSNGRQLGFARYGRADGVPAFYFHGLPGSRREAALLQQACSDAGVQLIAPERPGYGLSDPQAEHRVQQWPKHIEALAEFLGFDTFYLLATSGGAPYALACATRLAGRVKATAICCGMSEISRPELRAEMRINARLGLWLARRNPAWLKYGYGPIVVPTSRLMPHLSVTVLSLVNGPADRAVLRQPEVRFRFAENLREAFRQGTAGGVADMCAANAPWPFDLTAIRNLQLWHGLDDRVVPASHSRRLAAAVPGTRLQLKPGEGHFSLPVRYGDAIVKMLLEAA